MALIATVLTVDALASQTRLGRSALRDDIASFGVLANTDAELREIRSWFARTHANEWQTWEPILTSLRHTRVLPAPPINPMNLSALEPIGTLDTTVIAEGSRVASLAREMNQAPGSGSIRVRSLGGRSVDVVAIDDFRDAPLVQRARQSHTETIRKGRPREELWSRIRPLAAVADKLVIRDRYAIRTQITAPEFGALGWIAHRCADLPDRDRELTVFGTVAKSPFHSDRDYRELAERLVEMSNYRLSRVCIVPIPQRGASPRDAGDDRRGHVVPHDRVIRFATRNEQWSRRVIIGNSLTALETEEIHDDVTFAYRSLTPKEIDDECRIEDDLFDSKSDCYVAELERGGG